MDLGLHAKTALVAASTEGLGYASARALAAEGAKVWIGSRSEDKVQRALKKLQKDVPASVVGGSVLNVLEAASISRWVSDAAQSFGSGIDILVCNSGGPPPGTFMELDDSSWQEAFNLLVLSSVRLIRSSLPGLSKNGGSILIVSSLSVKEPVPVLILSNSIRSATVAMAKTLSDELAPRGIRINCLAPGRFATERVTHLDTATAITAGSSSAEVRETNEKAIPLGRYGDPDEYGRAACWLLSPAASYITGQLILADGGFTRGIW